MGKSYRAYFSHEDGTYVIDCWDADDERFRPDNETYFLSYEGAHAKIVKLFIVWMANQEKRFGILRSLTTEDKYCHERGFVDGLNRALRITKLPE